MCQAFQITNAGIDVLASARHSRYEPRARSFDECSGEHWDESGCRIASRSVGNSNTVVEVYPFKPYFTSFPSDVHIDKDLMSTHFEPSATGEPTGAAFASTPFEIYHTDSEPTFTNAGVLCGWTVTRTWTIRAV